MESLCLEQEIPIPRRKRIEVRKDEEPRIPLKQINYSIFEVRKPRIK